MNGKLYKAYHKGENEFIIYLEKSSFVKNEADVQVYVVNGNDSVRVLSAIMTIE